MKYSEMKKSLITVTLCKIFRNAIDLSYDMTVLIAVLHLELRNLIDNLEHLAEYRVVSHKGGALRF